MKNVAVPGRRVAEDCHKRRSMPISPGRSSESCPAPCRVQAICDSVSTREISEPVTPNASRIVALAHSMHEGIGVCRDFAASRHRAFARCMHIPSRHYTGDLGDIGGPIDINPMQFQRLARGLSGRCSARRERCVRSIPASAASSWDVAAWAPTRDVDRLFAVAKLMWLPRWKRNRRALPQDGALKADCFAFRK